MERHEAYADEAVWDPEGSQLLSFSGTTEAGDWKFCVDCRRVYQAGWYKEKEGKQLCPFPECSADAVLDPMTYRGEEDPEPGMSYMD